jgi:pimeloyl-ACP methyl ester carboxylesterase
MTPAAPLGRKPGVTIECVRDGDVVIETLAEGSGPAVVMLPSLGRDGMEDFDVTARDVAACGFRVLRPQPRGVGRSTGPMVGVGLGDLARDVHAVVRALGHGRAIIVGHAFGHIVARMTAANHRGAVRGLVLAAASARDTRERFPDIWATPKLAADASLPEAQRLTALGLGFFAHGNNPAAWLRGWHPRVGHMQRQALESAPDGWVDGTHAALEIIPEDDPFKPRDRWAELKAEYGARLTTVTVPGASHALFVEQPAAVARVIVDWAQGLPD